MKSLLPQTGPAALLRELSPQVPDAFGNQLLPRASGRGRRRRFSPAQLYRLHLLALLTPTHSFNLRVQMLSEQRAGRGFAHLPNPYAIPEVWMRHAFRDRLGVSGLRQINEPRVTPLLPVASPETGSGALRDATDLPASASGHKKSRPAATPPGGPPLGRARARPASAASSWATSSTPFGSGSRATRGACCGCPW